MKLILDFDSDSNYIYIMDKNYDSDGRTKDLLSFEFMENKISRERSYHLNRLSRPLQDGKLDILGVDMI